jgi:hypothetical protein
LWAAAVLVVLAAAVLVHLPASRPVVAPAAAAAASGSDLSMLAAGLLAAWVVCQVLLHLQWRLLLLQEGTGLRACLLRLLVAVPRAGGAC